MVTEEDFNGTKSPPKHLVETIGEIDGSSTLECRSRWHTVNRPPTTAVHLEAGKNILCDRSVDPP